MGSNDVVPSSVAREARSTVRRVGLALGLGFLALVVVPVTMAVTVALSGGDGLLPLGLLAFGILGFLFVLAALPVALLGIAWILIGSTDTAVESYVTEQRLRVLRWAETVEEARWWGSLVRPTERLSFVDPYTAEERFEADLDDAKSAYVAGDISETEFERRLDRLFGIEPGEPPSDEPDDLRPGALPRDDRRAEALAERIAR